MSFVFKCLKCDKEVHHFDLDEIIELTKKHKCNNQNNKDLKDPSAKKLRKWIEQE